MLFENAHNSFSKAENEKKNSKKKKEKIDFKTFVWKKFFLCENSQISFSRSDNEIKNSKKETFFLRRFVRKKIMGQH